MRINDLENYDYWGNELQGVKAIGWLEFDSSFPKGISPPEWIEKLAQLIVRDSVNQTRGFYYCDFCSKEDIELICDGSSRVLGSAEIWVPDNSTNEIYAAPNLIYHYIADHNYLPPQEFRDAVRQFDVCSDWWASKYLADIG